MQKLKNKISEIVFEKDYETCTECEKNLVDFILNEINKRKLKELGR